LSIFYEAGKLQAGKWTISAENPCVLMLDKTDTPNPELYIADPSQKLQSISININGKKMNYKLPGGPYAGSTAKFVVER
jgi:chondroitin AC lyase